MQTALLTVIVPIYNVEAWLDDCLMSVIHQTMKEIEVILVDDGSTDGSSEICKKYVALDSRLRYIRQLNSGLGPARNTGIRNSATDFVTFVDSDDVIAPTYCEALFGSLMSTQADISSCMFRHMSEAGSPEKVQENFIPDVVTRNDDEPMSAAEKVVGLKTSSISCARLYRKSLIEQNDLYFRHRLPHEDWFFTYKAFHLSRKNSYVREPLYLWRTRNGSLSKSVTQAHLEAALLLISDTEEFMARYKCSARFRSLAESRIILVFCTLLNRCARISPEMKSRFWCTVSPRIAEIATIFGRIDWKYLNQDVRARAARLIEEAAAHRLEADLAGNAAFNEVKKRFRNTKDNRDKLGALKNAFSGQRCFIIGNGPSLNRNDLNLLRGEYTFGVNSFFLKTRDTGFLPTFYVVEDNKVMEENVPDIQGFPAPFRFFPEEYTQYDLKQENTAFFSLDQGFYLRSNPYHGIPRFSAVARDVVYAGQTVTYANMQLAYYMGFSEVYLIGMDFEYHLPPEHKVSGNHILSTTDDPNHFHKDYFGKGKTWKDPKLDRVALNYHQAKLSYEAAGRRIYNATIGGKLEIFDRVDYETLLRDPATGHKRGTAPAAPPILPHASTGNVNVSGTSPFDLAALAAQLLLYPQSGRARLQDEAAAVSQALAALPEDSPVRQHFQRVRDFAEAG